MRGKGADPKNRFDKSSKKSASNEIEPDGWTEVSKRSIRAGSSFRSQAGSSFHSSTIPQQRSVTLGPQAFSTNPQKVGDLFFEASGSFFQDEDPVRAESADGSRVVRILEARRTTTDVTTPVSTSRPETDLSVKAPSFTPIANQAPQILQSPTHHPPTAPSPERPGQLLWLYLDPNGARQGPFTSSQMTAWYSAGYFPSNLPVFWYTAGEAVGARAAFLPLDQCYTKGIDPFTSPPIKLNVQPDRPQPPAQSHNEELKPRGWLWSPAEDAMIANNKQTSSLSLSDIMKAEQERGKSGKPRK